MEPEINVQRPTPSQKNEESIWTCIYKQFLKVFQEPGSGPRIRENYINVFVVYLKYYLNLYKSFLLALSCT